MDRVLYVIACGAPPAADVGQLVRIAAERDWDTCVLTSPAGRRFVDVAALEQLTGYPVRSEYKDPGEPDVLPPPDAIIVAPATVNTINKWGAGICDTLALGILVEAIGKGLPVVAVPVSNRAHAAHPAFAHNVVSLRSWGVTVLLPDDLGALPEPGSGADEESVISWSDAVAAIEAAVRRKAAALSPRAADPATLTPPRRIRP